jgi:hypothetical protein
MWRKRVEGKERNLTSTASTVREGNPARGRCRAGSFGDGGWNCCHFGCLVDCGVVVGYLV